MDANTTIGILSGVIIGQTAVIVWLKLALDRSKCAYKNRPPSEASDTQPAEFVLAVRQLRNAIAAEDQSETVVAGRALLQREELKLCVLYPKGLIDSIVDMAGNHSPNPGVWVAARGLFDRLCGVLPVGHGMPFTDNDADRLKFDKRPAARGIEFI